MQFSCSNSFSFRVFDTCLLKRIKHKQQVYKNGMIISCFRYTKISHNFSISIDLNFNFWCNFWSRILEEMSDYQQRFLSAEF